jgi:hypothetical protein
LISVQAPGGILVEINREGRELWCRGGTSK